MKRNITLVLILLLTVLYTYSQDVYKETWLSTNHKYGKVFYVNKADSTTKEGLYRAMYENKQVIDGHYVNGKREGYWNFKDQDGKLLSRGMYQNGEMNGQWEFYYEGYQPVKGNYSNGHPEGNWVAYYVNGTLSAEANYLNGKLNGEVRYYYEDGTLYQKFNKEEGKYNGEYEMYFDNGQLHQKLLYKEDVPFTVLATYDIKGNEIDGGDLKDGTGVLKKYYLEGKKQKTQLSLQKSYVDGYLQGVYKSYYDNGKVKSEGQYGLNQKVGIWNYYDEYGNLRDTEDNGVAKLDEKDSKESLSEEVVDWYYLSSNMPEFKGGESGLMDWLSSIEYPDIAKENDLEGQVFQRFLVGYNGEVEKLKTVRSSGFDVLDEAVEDHIGNMPPWMPGCHYGLPIKIQYIVPVRFKLN